MFSLPLYMRLYAPQERKNWANEIHNCGSPTWVVDKWSMHSTYTYVEDVRYIAHRKHTAAAHSSGPTVDKQK